MQLVGGPSSRQSHTTAKKTATGQLEHLPRITVIYSMHTPGHFLLDSAIYWNLILCEHLTTYRKGYLNIATSASIFKHGMIVAASLYPVIGCCNIMPPLYSIQVILNVVQLV